MTRDGVRIHELDRRACLELLKTTDRARVALSNQALPVIVPVRYRLVGVEILIDGCTGILAAAAAGGHIVCLQAEVTDPATSIAWSVAVTGQLRSGSWRATGAVTGILDTASITGCSLECARFSPHPAGDAASPDPADPDRHRWR